MQNQSPPFVRRLRRIIGEQSSGVSDTRLLERFVVQRDEAAFELLLWRHERMVASVCRWVLGHEQDAEDAFQATFLTLACKAGSIGKGQALASWLYKVAFRIALRARARVARKNQFEQSDVAWLLAEASGNPQEEVDRRDLHRAVCEEVHRLPEKYRAPVVLCYLEGRTNEQAAQYLRCPTGTVVTRLARARKRLRNRLAQRGIEIPAGLNGVPLLPVALPSSARAALVERTVRAAVHFSIHKAAVPGLVSSQAAALTKGALQTMLMGKLKVLALTVLTLALAGTGSAVWAIRPLPLPPQEPPTQERSEQHNRNRDDHKEKKSHKQARVEEVVKKSFKTGAAPNLNVEMFNGGIDVVAKTEGSVEVRVTKKGSGTTEQEAQEHLKDVDVQMTQDGDSITIKAVRKEQKKESHAGASAELQVPSGAILDLKTGNGPVSITGGTAKKTVHTSNGAIRVKGHTGPVELTTSNGAIAVAGGKGDIHLKTSNGSISIETDESAVTAHTSNGGIRFSGKLSSGTHTFHTSNGTVSVALPAESSFHIEARTSHGKVTSDFFEVKRSRRTGSAHVQADVGENPKTSIKIETSNGGVEIRKVGQAREERSEKKERKREPGKKAKSERDEE